MAEQPPTGGNHIRAAAKWTWTRPRCGAQPVSRIVRLTTDDETTVTVQLGDPPSPLPTPMADLMRVFMQARQYLPYVRAGAHSGSSPAASPDSR
ncbi:hypothetical protein AB0G67_46450 [Streptomyces sp. NPDC021056]|uniref:hypothetical protein n=1 Tax=Streptomyces sp. NPDC021056 TaxID=3155012 RepID=UPI0033DE3058